MPRRTTWEVPADVVFQTLGEEAVLLNLKTGTYWGLNRTGAMIWSEISRHGDPEKVLAALCERYDASEEKLAQAMESLLNRLSHEGLLVMGETRSS